MYLKLEAQPNEWENARRKPNTEVTLQQQWPASADRSLDQKVIQDGAPCARVWCVVMGTFCWCKERVEKIPVCRMERTKSSQSLGFLHLKVFHVSRCRPVPRAAWVTLWTLDTSNQSCTLTFSIESYKIVLVWYFWLQLKLLPQVSVITFLTSYGTKIYKKKC